MKLRARKDQLVPDGFFKKKKVVNEGAVYDGNVSFQSPMMSVWMSCFCDDGQWRIFLANDFEPAKD